MQSEATPVWAHSFSGRRVGVYCWDGGSISQGTAAWLRQSGIEAQTLEGGFAAWREAKQPLLCIDRLPARDQTGRTTWVTRARPKIVRIACPWLIRRFIDPTAIFLYVTPSEVAAVARRFAATPFDCGDGLWNDRGDACTFDVMLEEFSLKTEPLLRLAAIIRGADTGVPNLTLQSGGLLAISLGYSRMFKDDIAQQVRDVTLRCTLSLLPGRDGRDARLIACATVDNQFTTLRGIVMSSAISFDLAIFLLGTFAAAFVTGLAGFAFGMVAAGIWLFALTPVQTTTLILAYALLVQGYSTWRLRRTILPLRLLPFVIGSAVGIPVGIVVLEFASALHLRTAVGLLLIAFSLYNLLRPKMPDLKGAGRVADAGIGFINGVLGGSTGLGGILPTL